MSAFTSTIRSEVLKIGEGQVLQDRAPGAIDSFDTFEDGLNIGRLAKLDTGSIDNLDGSATPVIAGVPIAKSQKIIENPDTYDTSATIPDRLADLAIFGRVTILATDAAVPTRGAPVYVINGVANADNGKITQNSGEADALLVPDLFFVEEKATGIWSVTISKYLL